ncbi:hypothetical protein [Microbispora rosea]|uniref:hypothetical protein n=1 Tax=Microbispora rosea TaxID=58117 RepID=UPI0037AF5104
MNATTRALADQARAASRDAVNVLHAVARSSGATVHAAPVGPITAAILGRFAALAFAGDLTLCEHLSFTAPRPAFWTAWSPKTIRCAHCCEAEAARIRGTVEDRTCDRCHRVADVVHAVAGQLPAVVVGARAGRAPYAVPPVQVQFGLCSPCRAADQPPAALPESRPTTTRRTA